MYSPYRTRKTQGLWVCIIFIGLRKPNVCVNLFGIGEPIKLLFKRGGKRKTLTLESFIRFSFWNPSLLLQKKEFLLRFLYTFEFYNQAKSLALTLTLKILSVLLCEATTNQLQQSKDFCGVNHVLGFVQRSKLRIRIRVSNWLVMYWEVSIKRRYCHYRTSPIGYWGKDSTVGWYKVLGFLYL